MSLHLSQLAPRFRGLWVAIADDQATVLGSGKTAAEALKKAQKKQRPETLIITHLPAEDEIPNDELLQSIARSEEHLRSGKRKVYRSIDAMMQALA